MLVFLDYVPERTLILVLDLGFSCWSFRPLPCFYRNSSYHQLPLSRICVMRVHRCLLSSVYAAAPNHPNIVVSTLNGTGVAGAVAANVHDRSPNMDCRRNIVTAHCTLVTGCGLLRLRYV